MCVCVCVCVCVRACVRVCVCVCVSYTPYTLLNYTIHRLHPFILYLNSPLLATFYTSSFLDFIHEATYLLTLLTLLTLLSLLT